MILSESKVWISRSPTDMRKSIDGLSMLVAADKGPCCGEIFVFWNKAKDKIKILYWHINGFCLLYKRLEKERFKLPDKFTGDMQVSTRELRWLLDGLDFSQLKGHKPQTYNIFC